MMPATVTNLDVQWLSEAPKLLDSHGFMAQEPQKPPKTLAKGLLHSSFRLTRAFVSCSTPVLQVHDSARPDAMNGA